MVDEVTKVIESQYMYMNKKGFFLFKKKKFGLKFIIFFF